MGSAAVGQCLVSRNIFACCPADVTACGGSNIDTSHRKCKFDGQLGVAATDPHSPDRWVSRRRWRVWTNEA